MGTRIGFVTSEKGAEKECDVGLGLRMQTNDTKSLSRSKMMMMMSHHYHHDSNEDDDDVVDDEPPLYNNRAFGSQNCALGGAAGRGGGGGGGGGTTADAENDSGPSLFCNTSNHINNNNSNNSNQVVSMANIYNIVGSDSGSLLPKTLLIPNSETFYNPSGGIMVNASVRVPFTADQRQELERQTMIFKYMMASVPVPHQLLTPLTKTPSNFPYLHSNRALELGMSNSSDQEPWRCRRTDGKKWRCSRNVIPDQKYCERHSHKSRPRSRKHVELQSHFFNNNTTATATAAATNNTRNPYSKPDFLDHQRKNHQSPYSNSVVSSTTTTTSSHDQPRSMEWFMNSNQEWQHMIHSKQNESSTHVDMPKQTDQRERALELYNSQGLQQSQGLNDQFSLLLDPKLTPLGGVMDSDQTNKTRHFIDAWSTAERDHLSEICHNNRYSNSSNDKLPFSTLALSIHGGNNQSSEVSQNTQMGFGPFLGSGRESEGGEVTKSYQWMTMNNPVSWSGSLPPGGPLAEALCLGMAGSTRPPLSRGSS